MGEETISEIVDTCQAICETLQMDYFKVQNQLWKR